jgi:HD-GYP domain-containing protein (c-di-GMP phosphodiesterase class II)
MPMIDGFYDTQPILEGQSIHVEARIVIIVDGFDAMLSTRPYKEPMPFIEVMETIRRNRGQGLRP